MKENMEKYSQFRTTIATIKETKSLYSTQGGVVGVFPELKK